MKNNLFKVFLGTYNAEPWILDSIKSLEAQDCDPFSVVIIDNSSEDLTVNVLEQIFEDHKLKNSYELIKNNKNLGPISTFLDRLTIFDSEWLIMIHQDDYYHSNHISTFIKALQEVNDSTGLVFSAMRRIKADGSELLAPPTLASKLSNTDRISNFVLSLQISPVNFPACALRISHLSQIDTTRHTTAFNDMELILRLMCLADVKYIPVETMHYRIHSGNAASTTDDLSNDRAVLIGLNELFHSIEFSYLLERIVDEERLAELINGIEQSLNIRIKDRHLRDITKNLLAETLIRKLGYKESAPSEFLIESLNGFKLNREATIVSNLNSHDSFRVEHLQSKGSNPIDLSEMDSIENNLKVDKLNPLSLATREKFIDYIFNSFAFRFVKRPFVKVWRSVSK